MDDPFLPFLLETRFWVQRVLVPAIASVGVIGNAITIAVMTRPRMRSSSTHSYLAALAASDLGYLVLALALSLSHYPATNTVPLYWSARPIMLMLADACSNASVWLTVTFTAERWVAVVHPMRGRTLCTAARARRACAVVYAVCLAFAAPTPFEWQVGERMDTKSNSTVLYLQPSALGEDATYRHIYYWLTVALFIMLPFALLAVFNALLVRTVRRSRLRRSAIAAPREGDTTRERRITLMLLAVVALFFVCQLPTACHLLYSSTLEGPPSSLLLGLGNIFNCLMALNAAGNFVLYCLMSLQYRRTLMRLLCRHRAATTTVVPEAEEEESGCCATCRRRPKLTSKIALTGTDWTHSSAV